MQPLPEGLCAADLILPHAALAFVNAKRNGVAHRRADVLGEQALFVHAVAALVHDRTERIADVGILIARGDADIVAVRAAAEWMRGGVETTAIEVEADLLSDKSHEL